MSEKKYGLSVNLNDEAGTVEVQVRDKESDTVVESEVFQGADVHASLQAQTALYGLSKKLQDSTSDVKAGPGKLEAMREVMQNLTEGRWARERVGGAPTVSAEVEALARLKTGGDIAAAQKALAKYDKAQRASILANPAIVELAAAIKAERENAADISLDDLSV